MSKKVIAIFLVAASLLTRTAIAQSSFKFAHVSDTHVGGALTAADDLRNTVKDINVKNNYDEDEDYKLLIWTIK